MALAFLALAWLLGIAAAAYTGASPAASLAAAGLLSAAAFALRPRMTTIALALAGSLLVFGAAQRYEATRPSPPPIVRFNDGPAVQFRAIVDGPSQDRETFRTYRLKVRQTFERGRWRSDSGGVLMYAPLFPQYKYGDLLEVRGELETPPRFEGFDFRQYLLYRGVGSLVSFPQVKLVRTGEGNPAQAALFDLRERLTDSLARLMPEPEASLAAGAVLGSRSRLPQDLLDAMDSTGTSHLVAVSGQNVSLLAGLVIAALAWLIGRRPAAWASLGAIALYCALVGAQASVLRAGVMGAIYAISIAAGRQNTAAIALALAAAIMLAWNPQLAHDVSFQLSLAATLGLIVLAPALNRLILYAVPSLSGQRHNVAFWALASALTVTVAAIVFTAPIMAMTFHRISITAPLANMLVVPAFVSVFVTSGLAALVDLAAPFDVRPLGWLAWVPTAYTVTAIRWFGGIPAPSISPGPWGTPGAVLWYGAAFLGAALLQRLPERSPASGKERTKTARPRYAFTLALGTALLMFGALVWLVALTPSDRHLSVTVMDVGEGEAILIEDAGGHRILVDGGPSAAAIEAALGRRLPFYERRIDLVVLTHPQADHLGGLLAVMDRYAVGAVMATSASMKSDLFKAWQAALDKSRAPLIEARRGQHIRLAGGGLLTVLAPGPWPPSESINENSVVIRLDYGSASFLLTADMGEEEERRLLEAGTDLRADVLKVGHHGSKTSTSAAFLRRVQPEVGIVSVGAGNLFGHPAPEVLQRLAESLLLRTDLNGDVTVSTDGRKLWVSPQRMPKARCAGPGDAAAGCYTLIR